MRPVGAIAESLDLAPGPPLGQFGDGIVELPAGDKIQLGTGRQGFLGQNAHLGPHHPHLEPGVFGFELTNGGQIMRKRRLAGEEHGQFEIRGQVGHLGDGQILRRGVHHPGLRDETGGVAQPGGIPERGDFTGGLIARAGAAIKILERWRVEQQGAFHRLT